MTITIAAYASHSALGRTNDTIASALSTAHAPGMQEQAGYLISGQSLMLGTVLGELPAIPEHLSAHTSCLSPSGSGKIRHCHGHFDLGP